MSAAVCADCGHERAWHSPSLVHCGFAMCSCPAYRQEPAAVSTTFLRVSAVLMEWIGDGDTSDDGLAMAIVDVIPVAPLPRDWPYLDRVKAENARLREDNARLTEALRVALEGNAS